jgi:recombination protein RecT
MTEVVAIPLEEKKLNVPMKAIDLLQTRGIQSKMKRLLPENINFDRFFQIVVNEIRSKPKLLSCDPMSVIEAVGQAARLGLDVGGLNAHAHLIPYGNRCQFQPGYKGLAHLAYKAGIGVIETGVVFENDGVDLEYGLNPKLSHRPAFSNRGNHLFVWAMAVVNGEKIFTHMTMEEIEKARSYSKSGRNADSPWVTDYDQMCRKTIIIRYCKSLPQHSNSDLLNEAINLDEQAERGAQDNSGLFADDLVAVSTQSSETTSKADQILGQLRS